MKYSFLNDYSEGCHASILQALSANNMQQSLGYGGDEVSNNAREILREKIQAPNAAIHFVTGGTQANLLCVASMLKPFEAIIAPVSGHIAANEAGAIEATGHKIITVPAENGKLTVKAIEAAMKQFWLHPHMVRAKAVYISNATEVGTVYTKQELTALAKYCRQHDLYLLMDGARLGVALASNYNDLTLADIADLTDIFWLGGTKMGALFGEAIVISHDALKTDFGFYVKQHGAMLAKGRVLGVQFQSLLSDNLYLTLSKHANTMAEKLARGIEKSGYELIAVAESNQVFVTFPVSVIARLSESFLFIEWEKFDDETSVVRLVTSWATDEVQVDKLIGCLTTY